MKPDESAIKRLKDIDEELEKIRNLYKEYHNLLDRKKGIFRFPQGWHSDYQQALNREYELLKERKKIRDRKDNVLRG